MVLPGMFFLTFYYSNGRMKQLCSIILFLFVYQGARAQEVPLFSLEGRVRDDITLNPIPNVNVYLAGTTRGAASDVQGYFVLRNIPAGMYELVVSMVGYERRIYRVRLFEQPREKFDARLKEAPVVTEQVEVTARDPAEWREALERFNDLLFGNTEFGMQCRILNPEIIDFNWNRDANRFEATAREPLIIENRSLGYRLTFALQLFVEDGRVLKYGGATHFLQLDSANPGEMNQWEMNRKKAFRGSIRHFCVALMGDKLEQEGFRISLMDQIPKTQTERTVRQPAGAADVLKSGLYPFERILAFDQYLRVEYLGESPESGFFDFWTRQIGWREGVDPKHQTSWLQLDYLDVRMNLEGHIYDPFNMKTYGYWSYERLGEWLPMEYRP